MDHDDVVRGRGKNKCFWNEEEVQSLIEVLQDMACDPTWKTDAGFRSNYMVEVHRRLLMKIPTFTKLVNPHLESKIKWLKTKFHIIKDMLRESGCQWNYVEKKIACERQWFDSYCKNHKEAKGMWDFKFPYMNQLEMVYGKDKATGAFVTGFEDAILALTAEQNTESGGENLGGGENPGGGENQGFDYLPSSEEDHAAFSASQATPTTSQNTTRTKLTPKRKKQAIAGDSSGKKKHHKSSSLDVGAQLTAINVGFQTFLEGFTSNFGKIASAMTEESMREKAASGRMKEVINELITLNLPNAVVFKVANIFSSDKDKIDVFVNLPSHLKLQYVLSLI